MNDRFWSEKLSQILLGFSIISFITAFALLPNPRTQGLGLLCLTFAIVELIAVLALRRQRNS